MPVEPNSAIHGPQTAGSQPDTGSSRRVLIVQEDRVGAGVLAFMLRRAECTTLLATSNEEARHAVSWGTPDVILIDAQGAGLDGLAFAEELEGRKVCFFLLTDRASTAEEELEALRVGVADILVKPIDSATVLDRMGRRRPRVLGASPHPEGGIEIDLGERPLVDLLQMAARQRLNARLHVDARPEVVLWLRDGALIDAESGDEAGRAAATRALTQRSDRGVLIPIPADSEEMRRRATVGLELTSLLAHAFSARPVPAPAIPRTEPETPAESAPPAAPPKRRAQIGIPEIGHTPRALPSLPGVKQVRPPEPLVSVTERPIAMSRPAPEPGPSADSGDHELPAPWWKAAAGRITPVPFQAPPRPEGTPAPTPSARVAEPAKLEAAPEPPQESLSALAPAMRMPTVEGAPTRGLPRDRQGLRVPGVTRPRVRIPTPADVAPPEPKEAPPPPPAEPERPEADLGPARLAMHATEPRFAAIAGEREDAAATAISATRVTQPDLPSPPQDATPAAPTGRASELRKAKPAAAGGSLRSTHLEVLDVPEAASFWAREPEAATKPSAKATTQVSSLPTSGKGRPSSWRALAIAVVLAWIASAAVIAYRLATRTTPEEAKQAWVAEVQEHYTTLKRAADQALQAGQYTTALGKYEELLRLQPADGDARVAEAFATFHAKGCPEAEALMNAARPAFQSEEAFMAALLPGKVQCLVARGDFAAAQVGAQRFLELAPADHAWRAEAEKLSKGP